MAPLAAVTLLLRMLFLAPTSGEAAVQTACTDSSRFAITLLYSNDNIIRFLSHVLPQGSDDLVTMRVAGRVAIDSRLFVEISGIVLTDRKGDRRSDLASIRSSRDLVTPIGTLRYGAGLAARGNYGGSAVQNAYHRATRIPGVDVPYEDGARVRPLLAARYETPAWSGRLMPAIRGYLSASFAADAAPAPLSAGVAISCCEAVKRVELQSVFAYTHHSEYDPFLSAIFRSGFAWGGLAAFRLSEVGIIALWMTANEHGYGQMQYGLTLTLGREEGRGTSLFAFP